MVRDTSLAILILFMGGVQLVTIGVIGEYLGRIARQVKGRPAFVVDELTGFDRDHRSAEHVGSGCDLHA